jgi:Recombinase
VQRIAAELTRRGIKTRRGGKWAAQTVKNLLAREAGQ